MRTSALPIRDTDRISQTPQGGRALRLLMVLAFAVVTAMATAQAQTPEERPAHPQQSTIFGNTGLWKVFGAENLPRGGFSFSGFYDRINRNPGHLTISSMGVSGAVGITDWLELGLSIDINRRILARRQDQLSLGQQALGLFGTRTPGATPLLSELMPGSILPQLRSPAVRTGSLTGSAGYFNNYPWVGLGFHGTETNGTGPLTIGAKINILSENLGSPVGIAVRGYAVAPTHRSAGYLLKRSSQTGEWSWGSDVILSKYLGDAAELDFNAGYRANRSPGGGRYMRIADEVPIGIGIIAPRKTRLQVMAEMNADIFVGDHTAVTTPDARNPVDGTIGFRAYLMPNLAISGGYRRPFNQTGGDKNGFVAQLQLSSAAPRIIPPSPPSLSCSADPAEVMAGQPVTLTAQAVASSPNTPITYEWNANGGTIEGSGASVRVNTNGMNPGAYTATVRAVAGPVSSNCVTRFSIRMPPPPKGPVCGPLTVDRSRIQIGEIANLAIEANSPDSRPLTYQWIPTAGKVDGTGARTRWDSTGVVPGNHSITVRVTDDRNLSCDSSAQITVAAPPPPPPPPPTPQASMLNSCDFRLNAARVDNVCKAKLDDVALRLRNEGDAAAAVVGFAGVRERNSSSLAATRARNIKAYLVGEKGIAAERVQERTGPASQGTEGRRVEIHLIPRGASFNLGTPVAQTLVPGARGPETAAVGPALQTQPSGASLPASSAATSAPKMTAMNFGPAGRKVIATAR